MNNDDKEKDTRGTNDAWPGEKLIVPPKVIKEPPRDENSGIDEETVVPIVR